jgi:hypothetical protein
VIFCISELDDEDIISQAILFFLAGFDTTSTLLCFVCHQLATHPDVQKRLQEETDKTMQENGGKFTYEGVHSMKYLDMVVSGKEGPCSHTHIVNADCPLLIFLPDISPYSVYVRVISLLMLLLALSFSDITVPEACTNSDLGMNFQIGWYHPTVTSTVNNTEHNWCKQ